MKRQILNASKDQRAMMSILDFMDEVFVFVREGNLVINGFCKGGKFEAIDRLLVEMKERGWNVSVQVYNTIIDAQY